MKELMLSPIGMSVLLAVRILLGSICLCGGIHLLDFKKISTFFSWKRVVGIGLLTFGLRLLIDAIFFFNLA
jgi:hypothetical protein